MFKNTVETQRQQSENLRELFLLQTIFTSV